MLGLDVGFDAMLTPALAQRDGAGALPILFAAIGGAIALLIVIVAIVRWLLLSDDTRGTGESFTFADLERMLNDGTMTRVEYDAARAALIEREKRRFEDPEDNA